MLIFATSDKGGTGRSVTGCNLAYRCALRGQDVCYLDFDFGSPTAGAIFEVESATTGTASGGLHSLLDGSITDPVRLNVWHDSDRQVLRAKPLAAGELVLFPGDRGRGEFSANPQVIRRCAQLFLRLDEEFDVCFVDLSAGRSYAIDIALEVTGKAELRSVTSRWLVFHRWTRQHIVAASELVFGEQGLIKTGVARGHDEDELRESIRFVRTAILDPDSPTLANMRPPQAVWLRECHQDLKKLAARNRLGLTAVLGEIPMDPVLQWREQLITDADMLNSRIANTATVAALDDLAQRLTDKTVWEGL
ncbi:MAG: SCO2523 family variant P-loop protein [Kibdelosporangium sp.]